MSIFRSAAEFASDLADFGKAASNWGYGGWKLGDPNSYTFRFSTGEALKLSINTNFRNNFSVGFKLTF